MGQDEIARLTHSIKNDSRCRSHLLFSSSGTSGNRKWIALSKDALEWSARQVIETIGLTSHDTCGLALPVFHVGGFGLAARSFFANSTLCPYREKWNALHFTTWLRDQNVTVTSLVPTQLADLVHTRCESPSSLRIVIIGGGNLDARIKNTALELGWPVRESYGLTEASSQVATENDRGELTLLTGWHARSDDTLHLKGPGLLSGYLMEDDSRHFSFHDPKTGGWFATSDRVTLNDRKLTFLGRADRRVKILGELVDLDALETKLARLIPHPLILKTCHDARLGRKTQLIVENAPAETIARLLDTYHQSAPGFERIHEWKTTPALPRSPLGKILR